MSMPQQLDIVAKPTDEVDVEVADQVGNPDERIVYVHVNGITVLRVGHVPMKQLRRSGRLRLTRDISFDAAGFNPDDTTRET